MKNYVSAGNNITITAPAALNSGDGVLVGSLFGVASSDAAANDQVVIVVKGVFTLPKVGTQAWTVGDEVYWDAANNRCTTVMTANTLIGVAIAAVAGAATGTVRLNGTV